MPHACPNETSSTDLFPPPVSTVAPPGNRTHRTADFYTCQRISDGTTWSAVSITDGNLEAVSGVVESLSRIAGRVIVELGPGTVGSVLALANALEDVGDPVWLGGAGLFDAEWRAPAGARG